MRGASAMRGLQDWTAALAMKVTLEMNAKFIALSRTRAAGTDGVRITGHARAIQDSLDPTATCAMRRMEKNVLTSAH